MYQNYVDTIELTMSIKLYCMKCVFYNGFKSHIRD